MSSSQCKINKTINVGDSKILAHSCDAMHGSSGAPLIDISNSNTCVIGVQSTGEFMDKNKYEIVKQNYAVSVHDDLFLKRSSEFILEQCMD